ncbi:MAG TPA: hypothetical protein VNP94_10760 [Actinomycetota bacterium]|nr:hypothetical protein [Actinomycetota bacterium]
MVRRWFLRVVVPLVLLPALGMQATEVARAKAAVTIAASPNPAVLGQRVRHTVGVGMSGGLQVWVSATGFSQPGMGTLPPGTWTWECCPSQTAGTPAWHYRSARAVSPGTYAFGAYARTRGTFLSTASVSTAVARVWIRIV